MATIDELGFETERRGIIFHRDTTMPDGSQLGYIGDPNNSIPANSPGEFLLHNSPSGTVFIDKTSVPFIKWEKVSDAAGGIWISNTGGSQNSSVVELLAEETLGGGRIVVVFDDKAHYASPNTDYLSILGITKHAASIGDSISVLLQGPITDPVWSFTEGPIWLTDSGLMTQVEPITGVSLIVGRTISFTSFFFKQEIAIVRD